MAIFEVTSDRLVELPSTAFAAHEFRERGDHQRLLRDQADIIAPGVLVISEEFGDWQDSRRRIDRLGLDKQANLVVVELKRTDDGGHMELQAIRYAAMVSFRHVASHRNQPCAVCAAPFVPAEDSGSRVLSIKAPAQEAFGGLMCGGCYSKWSHGASITIGASAAS
jgi:hypothetical protein